MGFSQLTELVRAGIIEGVDPESVTKIRHLDHNRLLIERVESGTVSNILVGAGHKTLLR
jgi:hypothetical protein